MTPWERINFELSAMRRGTKWLADQLDISQQTVNHWKERGVPPKYYSPVEDVLGKPRGWVLEGAAAPVNEQGVSGYSVEALTLAWLLDQIPDRLERKIAENAATREILEVLQRSGAGSTHTPAVRAAPAKQSE